MKNLCSFFVAAAVFHYICITQAAARQCRFVKPYCFPSAVALAFRCVCITQVFGQEMTDFKDVALTTGCRRRTKAVACMPELSAYMLLTARLWPVYGCCIL